MFFFAYFFVIGLFRLFTSNASINSFHWRTPLVNPSLHSSPSSLSCVVMPANTHSATPLPPPKILQYAAKKINRAYRNNVTIEPMANLYLYNGRPVKMCRYLLLGRFWGKCMASMLDLLNNSKAYDVAGMWMHFSDKHLYFCARNLIKCNKMFMSWS